MPLSKVNEPKGPFNLLRPFLLISYALFYLFPTIFYILINRDFSKLTSVDAFKDEWFAHFWSYFGPMSREFAEPAVTPLLRNHARGVCLDIGPGSGQWLSLFSKADNPDIKKIYGIEPNVGFHKTLKENAVKAGLGTNLTS